MENAGNSLKKSKASGPDGIPNEIVREVLEHQAEYC